MPLTKVSAGVIAANAVQESVGSQSITGDKLGLTAINANNIVGGSITGAKLAANTVSGDVIGQNAISSNNIVSVSGSTITANTVANSAFQTGSIENYSRATGLLSGMRNRIINGAMVIDQRNAGANVAIANNASSYITDRFRADAPADQLMTFQQQTSIVPAGFSYSLKANASTATSNTSNQPLLGHFIEGFNTADLGFGTANAKTITLSFWVRSSLTGTFGVCFENNNADRGYIASYTINSANTFEYKTVTIPGDTSGTWETTNSRGMAIFFDLGFGTTYSSAASTTWANVERGLTGGVKLAANTGATWFITGVQLEIGSTATSFEYRQYTTELNLCYRYYYRLVSGPSASDPICTAAGYNATISFGVFPFPVTMRTTPDLEQSSDSNQFSMAGNATSQTFTSFSYNERSRNAITLYNANNLSVTQGYAYWFRGNSAILNPKLAFTAEL